MTNAPPPFSYAVNGNRHIFPSPTDIEIQDIKNSILLPQTGRLSFAVSSVSDNCTYVKTLT